MIEYIVECNEVIGITGKPIVVPSSIDLGTEVVRCKDCKNYHPELYNNISCEWFMFDVEPNGFCAWGAKVERKES